ncbi:MAG: dihydrofolate reductase [Bacteroidales bacterium]
MISIIVAIAEKNAIGHQQDLLCYLPADLKHFKTLTTGHPIIMGRKTFESLPKGALPNRTNIVMSRNKENKYPDTVGVTSLQEAIEAAGNDREIFIIGGASVYAEALPFADRMYLTLIHHSFPEADTFFPEWNPEEWSEITREQHPADEKNPHPYTFVTLERITQ